MGKTLKIDVMKILLITTQITNSGGVSSIVTKKANALTGQYQCEVAIVSTNDFTDQLFFSLNPKIRCYFLKTRMKGIQDLFSFKKELALVIDQFAPDVISVSDNGLKSFFVKSFVASRIPVVYEIHGNEFSFYNGDQKGIKSKIHQRVSKKFLPKFDAIVLQNSKFRLPKNVKKSIYIPNLIENIDHKLNVNSNKIVAVGRILSSKNYETLLSIWKKVSQQFPSKQLHIYGEWTDRSLVEKMKSIPNVFVHKPVANLAEIYHDAYLLVHASLNESFPMIFLEAMAFGVPIVCFDINQPKLVLHNTTGLVAASNDVVMFEKYFQELLENPTLREKFSLEAMQHVDQFSEQKVIEKWFNLYKSLIKI